VPVLAKFKAGQWDDSLPTMDLCTLVASPFFFQFEENFKCYESKLSTATILFSILAVGIFLGSLCFEALTSTAEKWGGHVGGVMSVSGFLHYHDSTLKVPEQGMWNTPIRISSLDLGNGVEHSGRSKQPSSQSDSSSLDPKSRTPEVSNSQPSTSSSSDTSSEGDSSQGKVQVFEKNSAGKNQPADQTNPKNISIAEKHSEVIQTAKYGPTAVMPLTTWQPKQVLVLASSESGSSSSSDEENAQRKTLQKQASSCLCLKALPT